MAKPRIALIVVLFAAFAQAAGAQTPPDASADLALMQRKAESEPQLREMFSQLTQTRQRPDMRERLERQVLGSRGSRVGLEQPYPYVAMADFQIAQNRAQVWSQLLSADLNNDGSVSKAEVVTVLQLGERGSIADAFFASDANDDSILSHEELRAEVERQVSQRNRGYDRAQMADIFDFDSDGSLTREELDRGMAALGYAAP